MIIIYIHIYKRDLHKSCGKLDGCGSVYLYIYIYIYTYIHISYKQKPHIMIKGGRKKGRTFEFLKQIRSFKCTRK